MQRLLLLVKAGWGGETATAMEGGWELADGITIGKLQRPASERTTCVIIQTGITLIDSSDGGRATIFQ